VRREDSLPTGWLVAGSFDGWGGVHETHFGLGNGGRFFTFSAPFYNAFVAAVKEALWHADSGDVLAAALRPRAFPDGTGTFGDAKFDT
jgi:hypothetical protein